MTYGELLEKLRGLDPFQLNQDIAIWVGENSWLPVEELGRTISCGGGPLNDRSVNVKELDMQHLALEAGAEFYYPGYAVPLEQKSMAIINGPEQLDLYQNGWATLEEAQAQVEYVRGLGLDSTIELGLCPSGVMDVHALTEIEVRRVALTISELFPYLDGGEHIERMRYRWWVPELPAVPFSEPFPPCHFIQHLVEYKRVKKLWSKRSEIFPEFLSYAEMLANWCHPWNQHRIQCAWLILNKPFDTDTNE